MQKMRKGFISLLIVCAYTTAFCQVIDLQNGIFGNEWIDYEKEYIKIEITEDKAYTLTYQDLLDAGVPLDQIDPRTIRIHSLGQSIPLYISDNFNFSENDFISFIGKKNRSELDTYLYEDSESMMLNDRHSIVNDTSGYFLSWGHSPASNRITQKTIDYNIFLPEQRVYNHIEERVYADFHYKPVENFDRLRYSSFVLGEGYGSLFTDDFNESIEVLDKVNVGVNPTLSIRFGTNRNELNTSIKINGNPVKEYFSPGLRNYLIDLDTVLDYSTITDRLDIQLETERDSRVILSNIQFAYTRNIDAGKGLPTIINTLPNNQDQYLFIKNYNGPEVNVINTTTNELYNTEVRNDNLIIFVPASSESQELAIIEENSSPVKISEARQFINFNDFKEKDYIFLTSKKLDNDEGGSNPIQEYADYRSTNEGGNYNPVIIHVEDLYDQFSFGINRHFLAIKHFAYFAKSTWNDLKFIYIVGKGREYANTRYDFQLDQPINSTFYVPTYGTPGSDNLLVSLGRNQPSMIVPIGRLAAGNKADIANYLDKVYLHDEIMSAPQSIEDRLWTKKVLHMSGGDKDIQQDIRIYLENMEAVIEASKMAADVTTFYKFSVDPIQVALSESLQQIINDGVSILTFFGHSAVGVLDFSIGNVADFNNYGKYPLAIALGCSSGNIHTTSDEGVSEEYVLTKDKGSIAFLASSSSAYASQQYEYGYRFYQLIGDQRYGSPIGGVISSVIDSLKTIQSPAYQTFFQQLTLHGDPALGLPAYDGPDFTPDGRSASTFPENVNSYEDDFEFCLDIVNLGSSYEDSVSINFKHQLTTGEIAVDTSIRIKSPSYKNQVCINIPILDNMDVGENTILVTIDEEESVYEVPRPNAELNNTLIVNGSQGYNFFVLNNSARPIYPKEFGIINNPQPYLLASTFNAFDEATNFVIQFDTTGSFDSPILVEEKLLNQRATIRWQVPYNLVHNTVYYWRVSPDTLLGGNQDYQWEESSFLYHKDIEDGWNQSHYHQFLKDEFVNMELNPSSRKVQFIANFSDYTIENRIFESTTNRPHYYINGDSKNVPFTPQVSPGISISLVDSFGRRLLTPFPETEYGTYNNRGRPIPAYLFRNVDDKEVRQNIIRFLENEVEEGVQVILNTILWSGGNLDFKTDEWAMDSIDNTYNLFNYLENKGATKIREMESKGGLPYVFSYIEGKGLFEEQIADSQEEEIIVKMLIKGLWFEGSILSTQVGPALEWEGMSWSEQLTENPENDQTFLTIYLIDNSGNETLYLDSITQKSVDLTGIDANQYPYLRFRFNSQDETDLTSANLISWNTIYKGLGDLAISNTPNLFVHKDTLQEGDPFRFTLPVTNYLNSDFSGIKALVSIKDKENNIKEEVIEVGDILKGETKNVSFQYPTVDNLGDYIASVTINHTRSPEELFYFNNFANIGFHVFREKINPTMDVTFDGVHILDDDIVSSQPRIVITLKDENPFLLLDDPSLFLIQLQNPDGTLDSFNVNDPRVNFTPASDANTNQAQIELSPIFEQEGQYKLLVQSMDKSKNVQGTNRYEVQFRVILKEAVSEVYNYPNPFSTSTEFVFTLTGSSVPDNLAIQIMTISGKVVREIKKEELGPIKIGLNRTTFKWDGTDEYGSKLANGVYLYRMIVRDINGKAYENFDVGVDQSQNHFKKGWGKMVIMR